jgi:hypothetical protein
LPKWQGKEETPLLKANFLILLDPPTVDNGNRTPLDYIYLQYNYENSALSESQWFNPYTHLIHAAPPNGLGASAYAFSIDDQASFVSNSGGSLPGGLVIAVGSEGLAEPEPASASYPALLQLFRFRDEPRRQSDHEDNLGEIRDLQPACDNPVPATPQRRHVVRGRSEAADLPVHDFAKGFEQPHVSGHHLESKRPARAIWPFYCATNCTGVDSTVVSCPSGPGILPPKEWCQFINETTDGPAKPPVYSLSTREPLQPSP